ncbi:MAG: SDR family NAD(P)-dependent oxidoreductase [Actinobacteria bacterium]|nr:SDR family NAD(P)-dependent oxidoreductase [Actinomycetota bacterium]
MIDFTGKSAIITGGANGIGKATAELLANLGAQIVIFDQEAPLEKSEIKNIVMDLSDLGACKESVASAQETLGKVDILVNIAGVSIPNLILDLDQNKYHRTLAVNLHAPVYLMHLVGAIMAKQSYGRIVNLTSVQGSTTEPTALAYGISKAALESATRTAAIEFAEFGILVNAVAPGFVSTRMSIYDGEDELESDWFKSIYLENKRLPIARAAQPIDIAKSIAWLVSDSNTYVTGQTLSVDGGMSARF